MARLDRVPAAKEVAQVGSVIGREFMYELIAGLDLMGEESLGDGAQASDCVGDRDLSRRNSERGLRILACAGPGRGLRLDPQEPAQAAARRDRAPLERALARDARRRARVAGLSPYGRRTAQSRGAALAARRRNRDSALRLVGRHHPSQNRHVDADQISAVENPRSDGAFAEDRARTCAGGAARLGAQRSARGPRARLEARPGAQASAGLFADPELARRALYVGRRAEGVATPRRRAPEGRRGGRRRQPRNRRASFGCRHQLLARRLPRCAPRGRSDPRALRR